MKSMPYLFAGIAMSVAYYFFNNRKQTLKRSKPVDALAHKLQDAWADHHTIA